MNRGLQLHRRRQNCRQQEAFGMQREATTAKFQRTKFSVSLSREEIEEDFLDLTRRRPARKPKKRLKYIQKQLDTLFPGLWLLEITPDMYKVNENSEGSSSVMNNGHGERLMGYESEHGYDEPAGEHFAVDVPPTGFNTSVR